MCKNEGLKMEPQPQCCKCGICCIALSISSLNKKSGKKCKHLSLNNLCNIWGKSEEPSVCRTIKPLNDLCRFDLRGNVKKHFKYLMRMERITSSNPTKMI